MDRTTFFWERQLSGRWAKNMKAVRRPAIPILAIALLCLCGTGLFGQEGPSATGAARPKRAWGPEQATGASDTSNAGDLTTAWAPLQPNAGTEWLYVGFQRVVVIAEVRIRETFNPGAVSKVVALVDDYGNGNEQVLWEGQDPTHLCRPISLSSQQPELLPTALKSISKQRESPAGMKSTPWNLSVLTAHGNGLHQRRQVPPTPSNQAPATSD